MKTQLGKTQLGTWMSIGSPIIAELAAQCGFDWLLLDLEHGCGTEAVVMPMLQALRGSSTAAIVRVGALYPDLIARVLDWGVHGIMVPHVNSAEEAAHIVQATRYAPHGQRGYSRTVRANDYGLRPLEEVRPPVVMTQIETVEGVSHAADIARVDGVDVLFIGPADLQHDLKHRAASAPGDYAHCLRKVVAAAQEAGKQTGILIRDLTDLTHHHDLGFTHIAVDSDLAILRKSYLHIISSAKQTL